MKSLVIALLALMPSAHAQLPDISSIEADLQVPELTTGKPSPGERVKQKLPTREQLPSHHVLYLPEDWTPDRSWPVLVEFAGNGPYRNKYHDISTGRVEGSKLGYGISGGEGFIWLCVPYLDETGHTNVTRWWGTKPDYNPQPTIDYCLEAVNFVCSNYGGDTNRLVLCGFSRGAIACNFIGLHDDRIAPIWRAFIPYSHYDGVITRWPYPGDDRKSALSRLRRLNGRPQFICGENDNADKTRDYLRSLDIKGDFTFAPTGFRNHNDAWTLRPTPARAKLRAWLQRVLRE
ncbi:MAG: hypothetical protein ACPGVU_02600 [Limisphaerales bacterium]